MTVLVARTESDLTDYIANNPSHRVWGYVRVSSKTQEDNQSLEAQQEAIESYCAKNKLGDPAIVVEVGSATKPLFAVDMSKVIKNKKDKEVEAEPRPLFLMVIAHTTQIKNSHLVVYKLDRLSRVSYDQEMVMNLMSKEGATLHSTVASEQNILSGKEDDPSRALMRQIFAAIAQYEAGMIKMRMEMGRRFKASQGGFTGGRPPFGYNSVNKELKVNVYEAGIVRVIHELRHDRGWSQQAIADYLNSNKSPDAPEKYDQKKISRVLSDKYLRLYNGHYTDYYGRDHYIESLIILPEKEQTDG